MTTHYSKPRLRILIIEGHTILLPINITSIELWTLWLYKYKPKYTDEEKKILIASNRVPNEILLRDNL